MKIGNKVLTISDEPTKLYSKDLDNAKNLADLKNVMNKWQQLINGAYQTVLSMTGKDFVEFKKGLRKERRGSFAGDDWADKYSDILIPDPMLNISIVANYFKVPFVIAMERCIETKKLIKDEETGNLIWVGK